VGTYLAVSPARDPHSFLCLSFVSVTVVLKGNLRYKNNSPLKSRHLLLATHQTEQHLQVLQRLEQKRDPTKTFTATNRIASRIAIERCYNRKHEHHLQTIIAIQYHHRL